MGFTINVKPIITDLILLVKTGVVRAEESEILNLEADTEIEQMNLEVDNISLFLSSFLPFFRSSSLNRLWVVSTLC